MNASTNTSTNANKVDYAHLTGENNIDQKRVIALLNQLGLRPNLLGYIYLVNIIRRYMDSIRKCTVANEKIVATYCEVAKDYNTTGSRVERSIRHAIEAIRENRTYLFKELFPGQTASLKNSEFIMQVAMHLVVNG